MRVEHIGDATLYLGDCRDVLPTLGKVDAIITDPPYSARTHANHDARTDTERRFDGAAVRPLGYAGLSVCDAITLAELFHSECSGWIAWITDANLAHVIGDEMELLGRTRFLPLPYFHAGRSVRLAGDGPCSWTDWIVVSRTKAQSKWGTLRGGYIAGAGWDDKERMGGKPTRLMRLMVCDYSRPNDLVCDPFMGAGTTGVAAITEGRRFVGIEIDEAAFDIACKRIAEAYAQPRLFAPSPHAKPVQPTLFGAAA